MSASVSRWSRLLPSKLASMPYCPSRLGITSALRSAMISLALATDSSRSAETLIDRRPSMRCRESKPWRGVKLSTLLTGVVEPSGKTIGSAVSVLRRLRCSSVIIRRTLISSRPSKKVWTSIPSKAARSWRPTCSSDRPAVSPAGVSV